MFVGRVANLTKEIPAEQNASSGTAAGKVAPLADILARSHQHCLLQLLRAI